MSFSDEPCKSYIPVILPQPGVWAETLHKLDVYDKDGNLVRVDEPHTWYEVTDTRIKWETIGVVVICDMVRLNDNQDKMDEAAFEVIYREDRFGY